MGKNLIFERGGQIPPPLNWGGLSGSRPDPPSPKIQVFYSIFDSFYPQKSWFLKGNLFPKGNATTGEKRAEFGANSCQRNGSFCPKIPIFGRDLCGFFTRIRRISGLKKKRRKNPTPACTRRGKRVEKKGIFGCF